MALWQFWPRFPLSKNWRRCPFFRIQCDFYAQCDRHVITQNTLWCILWHKNSSCKKRSWHFFCEIYYWYETIHQLWKFKQYHDRLWPRSASERKNRRHPGKNIGEYLVEGILSIAIFINVWFRFNCNVWESSLTSRPMLKQKRAQGYLQPRSDKNTNR